MSACCVSGCKNRHSLNSKLKFYRIPSGYRPFQANRRRLWLQAIQQVNGSTEELKGNVRICGAHFISGEASMDHDSPDFVPSVFTCAAKSTKKNVKRFFGHRRRRRHPKANAEKEETPPTDSSPTDLQASVLMETELPEEIQTSSTLSVPKEGETLTKEAEAETGTKTTSDPNKTSESYKVPTGILKLHNTRPVVLLKRLVVPSGEYQCTLCNQNFISVSQLDKHKQLHEEEKSFICEKCGKHFTNQADFTEHQCDDIDEPSFQCNMCDRSFTTSHNLKRHKLLHVKDGRKCSRCGVLFCQRHGHVFFKLQDESEQDSSNNELQNVDSDMMPENSLLVKSEQSHTDDLNDDAQNTGTVTPLLTATATAPPHPGPLSKTFKAPPPASHTRILLEIPVPVLLKPSLMLDPPPPPPIPMHSGNPGTSSQHVPPMPNCSATFVQPSLPQHPELPPSLKLFSPQYLTSALLEVKRNYEYILSKPGDVKNKVKKEIVKEEPCELPLMSPGEQSVEKVKNERIAYDLEIVV
ncbi:zinc finger protein 652-B-like [Toxotes jaculatrix]|uniref:zinc finger protein 652-B-like n=1 Tax=Toxotes jaculatrix TaxID=941984 RepID=UPI001B3A8D1F|nr:zinc finger protein 652-B-like [Toxotes jaculatrix]